jgi:AcrR family transcriptional regulator
VDTAEATPSRERLIAAASDLFYRQGVQRSGVDDIVAAAGLTKPTLYSHFRSKDELVEAVLERRFANRRAAVEKMLARAGGTAREQLVLLFTSHEQVCRLDGFRGCPLVNCAIEMPDGAELHAVARRYKAWTRELLTSLAREAGLREPRRLARGLMLLLEGANVLAYVESDPGAGRAAREAAETLIAAHAAKPR